MNVKSSMNILVGGTILSAATLFASSGMATVVDLTHVNTFGTINGARFETSDFRSAGTGVIDSFVRIQHTGTERGYNTSGRPTAFDENTSGQFTRNLRLSELPTRNIGGTNFYEFILDINQTNATPLLSLNHVEIRSGAAGSLTTSTVSALGTLRYDMNPGDATHTANRVELDYSLQSGSGQGDMNLYVPVSNFAGALATDFVYLYSEFGTPNGSNDGFEEWAIRTNNPVNPVPLPAAAGMGLAGLSGLALVRRRNGR